MLLSKTESSMFVLIEKVVIAWSPFLTEKQDSDAKTVLQ